MAKYNRVYTKQKWEQVNKYNKDLLSDYMLQIKAEGKAKGTMDQYFNDARIILIYVLEELDNKPLYKLNRKSFRNMILWMKENELSSNRINRMLSVCRNLLNFGLDDDDYSDEFEDCKANPARIKGITKEKVRQIIFLTDEEIEYIYNRLIEKKKFQQALLCSLMYDSAARRNECFQVEKDFVKNDPNFTNVVIGKRNKKFNLLYRDRTKKAYELYIQNRNDDSEYLWITKSNGQIIQASYESLYAWVISWRSILEEKFEYKEFNPHSFRHSSLENYSDGSHYVCREFLDGKPLSLEQLKILAHHEDVSVTLSYLKSKDNQELLNAFNIQ